LCVPGGTLLDRERSMWAPTSISDRGLAVGGVPCRVRRWRKTGSDAVERAVRIACTRSRCSRRCSGGWGSCTSSRCRVP
jgi:hypothetical protein